MPELVKMHEDMNGDIGGCKWVFVYYVWAGELNKTIRFDWTHGKLKQIGIIAQM